MCGRAAPARLEKHKVPSVSEVGLETRKRRKGAGAATGLAAGAKSTGTSRQGKLKLVPDQPKD